MEADGTIWGQNLVDVYPFYREVADRPNCEEENSLGSKTFFYTLKNFYPRHFGRKNKTNNRITPIFN